MSKKLIPVAIDYFANSNDDRPDKLYVGFSGVNSNGTIRGIDLPNGPYGLSIYHDESYQPTGVKVENLSRLGGLKESSEIVWYIGLSVMKIANVVSSLELSASGTILIPQLEFTGMRDSAIQKIAQDETSKGNPTPELVGARFYKSPS